jgi:hypothetical protein
MSQEAAERRAVRQQDREVEETKAPALRHGRSPRTLDKLDQGTVVVLRTQDGLPGSLTKDTKAQHVLVIPDRSRKIGDLKPYRPKASRVRQPMHGRPNTVLGMLDERAVAQLGVSPPQLGFGVHHDRPLPGHGLLDRPT